LFARIQAGDADAVAALYERYATAFRYVIRARLKPELRSTLDSTDVLQSAFRELLLREGYDEAFASPEAFVAFLKTIIERKVLRAARKRRPEALTPNAEEQVMDRAPPAHEVVSAEERWRKALAALPLVYRRVAILWREGHSQTEIAAEVKISERTVRTAITRLREAWNAQEG
jgi:RNA polymerase sigma factor (sigma-70 family)